ncbi:hypothetical protein MBANPS3_012196 [Mucor bainieri]
MSKRKGGNPRRKDNDFDRNGRLLVPRDSVVTSGSSSSPARQLFDPRSDNPIAFNKQQQPKNEDDPDVTERRVHTRQQAVKSFSSVRSMPSSSSESELDAPSRRPPPPSGRRLWSADGPSLTQTSSSSSLQKPERLSNTTKPAPASAATKPITSSKKPPPPPNAGRKKENRSTIQDSNSSNAPLPEEEQDPAKEAKRKQLKALIASLKSIEAKLEQVAITSRSLPCFSESNDMAQQAAVSHDRRRRSSSSSSSRDVTATASGDRKVDFQEQQPVIVEQDIVDADSIWREKISLHLALGEKYLEMLTCDLEYAEKKGLESLCWKRAVYSLVDQFRKALRKSASDIAALNAAAAAAAAASSTDIPSKTQSALAAMLFDEDDDGDDSSSDNNMTEIPVIHEGGGMTFIKVEKPKPEETKLNEHRLHLKQARMMLTLFLHYLELADDFYRKLSLFLKSVDDDSTSDMDAYLNLWRRTRKYKWYTCIPLRGDIARYRWAYTPEQDDDFAQLPLEQQQQQQQQQHDDEKPITTWTKQEAFYQAWQFYSIGTWLMPAKGNLYFNLSLLLQQPPHLHTQGQDFHKLYFSTRSLMVRRNGFLNARESMLALFEGNRRWVHKHIESGGGGGGGNKHGSSLKSSSKSTTRRTKGGGPKMNMAMDKNITIPALFVRLHGMLFTKIGLDEFPRIKRAFFETLFEINHTQPKQEDGFDRPIVLDTQASKPVLHDPKTLSASHLFWLETVIVCLSSLYTYDFANAKFTKLLASNAAKRFHLQTSNEQVYQSLAEDMGDSVLFAHEVDLTCQIAVELLRRYLDPLLPSPSVPQLPALPPVALSFSENEPILFGPVLDENGARIHTTSSGQKQQQQQQQQQEQPDAETDAFAWLVYIEILLHWMVLNGVCIRSKDQVSLWETIVGDIGYDFIFPQGKRLTAANENRTSKISPAFWPLLLQFLNKLLSELPTEEKYDMVNKHLLDNDDPDPSTAAAAAIDKTSSVLEYEFTKNILAILGKEPDLPEESLLRGLGWVDEIHGRFLRLEPDGTSTKPAHSDTNTISRRKLKILDYGFMLVKHLDDILYYDPVEEVFTVAKSVEERAVAMANELTHHAQTLEHSAAQDLYDDVQNDASLLGATTIAEMDDDVLLSSETDLDEQNEGDDFMTQLKKRREQLQSIVVSSEAEERFGYRRLPARVKEREARLNYLRECIIPGKTILVLDTNCFIGHLDLVKKLFKCQKWSIIVPLVVVTELDGLRTNTHRLGVMAQQGIELLQTTLAAKPKQSTSLRIQTSHNNFMNDISIRSEQFVFGESDKNLDDLILSTCLWWVAQQQQQPHATTTTSTEKAVPVCLVTGDRNLSVKARARDVEILFLPDTKAPNTDRKAEVEAASTDHGWTTIDVDLNTDEMNPEEAIEDLDRKIKDVKKELRSIHMYAGKTYSQEAKEVTGKKAAQDTAWLKKHRDVFSTSDNAIRQLNVNDIPKFQLREQTLHFPGKPVFNTVDHFITKFEKIIKASGN